MDRTISNLLVVFQRVLFSVLFGVLFVGCGGGGGGGGSSPSPSNPIETVQSFSSALKSDSEAEASVIFAESTRSANLEIWRTFTPQQRKQMSALIDNSIKNIALPDNVLRTEVNIRLTGPGGIVSKAPITLIKEKGSWKILNW